jgi:hypothetical protein
MFTGTYDTDAYLLKFMNINDMCTISKVNKYLNSVIKENDKYNMYLSMNNLDKSIYDKRKQSLKDECCMTLSHKYSQIMREYKCINKFYKACLYGDTYLINNMLSTFEKIIQQNKLSGYKYPTYYISNNPPKIGLLGHQFSICYAEMDGSVPKNELLIYIYLLCCKADDITSIQKLCTLINMTDELFRFSFRKVCKNNCINTIKFLFLYYSIHTDEKYSERLMRRTFSYICSKGHIDTCTFLYDNLIEYTSPYMFISYNESMYELYR